MKEGKGKKSKKTDKKEMQEGARRIPQGGASGTPKSGVTAFPLGRACSSQERWLQGDPGTSCYRNPHSGSPVALPNASHCRLSSPCCLPFTKPKVSGCEQKTCSLVPLREKTKKKTQWFHLSPAAKNPVAFHRGMLRGWLILALVLLCASELSLGSRLFSRGSPHSHLITSAHGNGQSPFTSLSFLLFFNWFLAVLG